MAGGSGGHQTVLNEIGSARLMAPQHEATGGRVRIGLCPAEHTVWFDVRGVLRFCADFNCDESARRGTGGADMVKVQRPWQRPGGLTERMPGSWSCEFPASVGARLGMGEDIVRVDRCDQGLLFVGFAI